MKKTIQEVSDVKECQEKILMLLKEYNCRLFSSNEVHHVILEDNDTNEALGFDRLLM